MIMEDRLNGSTIEQLQHYYHLHKKSMRISFIKEEAELVKKLNQDQASKNIKIYDKIIAEK
jgi:hypothetical protein